MRVRFIRRLSPEWDDIIGEPGMVVEMPRVDADEIVGRGLAVFEESGPNGDIADVEVTRSVRSRCRRLSLADVTEK